MKKLGMWGSVLLLVLVASVALAQVYYQNRGTTLQSAVGATGNGSTLDVTAGSVVVYQVSGTWTGTVTFEGSLDGTNWTGMNCQAGLSSTVVSSTTSNGFFFCPTNGIVLARGRFTFSTGTVTVNAAASSAPAVGMLTSISGLTSPSITTGLNDANGNQMIGFSPATTAVNNIVVTNAIAGSSPSISTTGTGANINLILTAKGASSIQLGTAVPSSNPSIVDQNGNALIIPSPTTSAVNGLKIINAATGTFPGIGCGGVISDANCGLQVALVGTGTFQVKSAPGKAVHMEVQSSSAPTIGGGAGNISAGSTDMAGEAQAGSTSAVILFATAWTNRPFCTVVEVTHASAITILPTTSSLTISNVASSDILDWTCIGRF